MTAWQPIETAPRDGTMILGYDPRSWGRCFAAWEEKNYPHDGSYGWRLKEADDGNDIQCHGIYYNDVALTHWMPLPAPPGEDRQP